AVTLRDQWQPGKVLLPLVSLLSIDPQLLDPTPKVMLDLNFRKAVLMAINRQEMADEIEYGLLPMADGVLDPTTPLAKATEGGIVKYPFNPRQPTQIIESLGYTKRGSGFYKNASGQPLHLKLRATMGDI